MFIGLNGQRLLIDDPAGPEKYSYHIYQSLAKIDKENNYVIYFSDTPQEKYFRQLSAGNRNFSYKVISSKISWTQNALSEQLFKDKPDIFFSPVHTLPIFRPAKTKYISMVHGLEFKHIVIKNPVRKFLLGKPEKYVCNSSDFIIVPSEGTKDEIVKKHWAGSEKIGIVQEGVDSTFFKRPTKEIASVREKYKLNDSPYFIFVGTVHPRKNLPATIKAFAAMTKKFPDKKILFAIAGKLGWDYEESLDAPKKYKIEDKVFYLGRVPDDDLPALISGATALVSFSLEEGFGLPLLEAMACETRCVIADIPPYKEICGDLAIYASPKKISEMEKGLSIAYTTIDASAIERAKKLAGQFTWEASAKKTLAIFNNVFENS